MSNLSTAAVILATLITVYAIAMYVTDLCTRRGDQIIAGVTEGVVMSSKARWMAVYCQWMPSAAFLVGFLFLAAAGLLMIAKQITNPEVALFARGCAGFFAIGGVFWGVIGSIYLAHMISAVRDSQRK
jgi:hypothetical protein